VLGGGQSRPTITTPTGAPIVVCWRRVDDRETVDIDEQFAIVGAEAIAQ
jgi:hypothetical protein